MLVDPQPRGGMPRKEIAMKDTKVVAFFKEFPFLRKLLREEEGWEPCVKRVDYDLLISIPCYCEFKDWLFDFLDNGGWVGKMPYSVQSAYALLDKNGEILSFVGVRWWNPMTWTRARETVGDAIARLGNRAKRVFFVVHFSPQGDHSLTVYKPPRGFTIQDWLEEEIRRKRAAVQEEVQKEQTAIQAKSQAIDALADQK